MAYFKKNLIALYRRQLKKIVIRYGTTSIRALRVSQRLDRMILDDLQNQASFLERKAGDKFGSTQ